MVNGSFETNAGRGGEEGWYFPRDPAGRASVAVVDTTFRHGGRSLLLRDPIRNGVEEGRWGVRLHVMQYLPALKPNTKYLLTYFYRTEGVTGGKGRGGAILNIHAGLGMNLFWPNPPHAGDQAWTKQGIVFETPDDTNRDGRRAYLRLGLVRSDGKVWLDDIRIREYARLFPESAAPADAK